MNKIKQVTQIGLMPHEVQRWFSIYQLWHNKLISKKKARQTWINKIKQVTQIFILE